MKERKSWTAVLLCIRRYASGPLINNFGRQFRRGTGLAHTEARKSCTWLNDVTRLSRYLIAFLENVPRNRIAFGFGPTLRNRAVVRSSRKWPDDRFFLWMAPRISELATYRPISDIPFLTQMYRRRIVWRFGGNNAYLNVVTPSNTFKGMICASVICLKEVWIGLRIKENFQRSCTRMRYRFAQKLPARRIHLIFPTLQCEPFECVEGLECRRALFMLETEHSVFKCLEPERKR